MPPALLLTSFILAFHRGRPVRLRVFCSLMLPLMFSCVVHSVIAESLPWDASLAQTLWQSGEALSSGGVLSGVLGQAFVQVFSRVGAAVVFVLALLMLGLGAFNRTIVDVADWFFSRPRYEYEPQDPPERPVVRVPQPAPGPPDGGQRRRTLTFRWTTAPWWARSPLRPRRRRSTSSTAGPGCPPRTRFSPEGRPCPRSPRAPLPPLSRSPRPSRRRPIPPCLSKRPGPAAGASGVQSHPRLCRG